MTAAIDVKEKRDASRDGETDSAELLAGIATAGSTHLRELTALPRAAADQFDTRLARVPN